MVSDFKELMSNGGDRFFSELTEMFKGHKGKLRVVPGEINLGWPWAGRKLRNSPSGRDITAEA